MKYFTFLKPVFSLGMLVFLSYMVLASFLIFKYLGTSVGAFWFVIVYSLSACVGYVVARALGNPDGVIWPFARKWWNEKE